MPTAARMGSAPASVVGRRSSVATLNWWLAAIIVIGFVLRLWLLSVNTLDPRFSNADDGDYYHRALRFAVTGHYIDDSWLIRPPLHVAFFALWLRLVLVIGQPQLGVLFVQLAQVVVGTLTIALGYGVARRLFANVRAGLLFAAFLALWHPFVEQPTVLFSELLYLFLFLLHVWLLLRFDATNRLRDLALSGLVLGAAALTRSPALYSVAFVALWLLVRRLTTDHRRPLTSQHQPTMRHTAHPWSVVVRQWSVVVLCCLAVVGPWTARNYVVYGKLIPVDTLGQVNLWLDLDKVSARNDHIEEMRGMPQAERAGYAMGKAREILREDPLRPFRPMWATFRHIWKAQFIEDYYVKQSFFTRPLRAVAPLGLLGDALWLVFTVAGLVGLASPAREGWHNRLFFLLWLGYSFFTVLVFHVEPRYLIPIWMLFGLYGAGTLAAIRRRPTTNDERPTPVSARFSSSFVLRPSSYVQIVLVVAFAYLFITYRDYPYIIAHGVARESAIKTGERAYAKNDYLAAERAFRTALVAQPNFVDAQIDLALALIAQNKRDEAAEVVKAGGSRQAELVLGTLARAAGDDSKASVIIRRIESTSGEDTQSWALEWLRPPPISALQLGNGLDIGYIAGFSPGESDEHGAYRWLEGAGRIELPLPAALPAGATLALRMSGGWSAQTALEVRMGGVTQTVPVTRGEWRTYYLPIPPTLAGQQRLVVELRAPTFVPARVNPASDDARTLSLMVSTVRVR